VFEIEDLSSNGTYVNGVRIEKGKKVRIKNGDEIGVVIIKNEIDEIEVELTYIFRDAN